VATLGDGSACGKPFEVKPMGNIPKYCPEHRSQQVRTKLERQARRAVLDELRGPSPAAANGDEQELDESAGVANPTGESAPEEAAVRVCRASSCSIPLSDEWLNEFCPAHWRILPLEIKGDLAGSRSNEDLHDVAILRSLKAINRYEGRADYQSATSST
jgi:hypothetical protein